MRTGRGFTLLELLATVGIIAILMAVLLPALAGARAQARSVVCASNLRQLAIAFHMYADEHLGRAMPLAYTERSATGRGSPVYWWGTNDPSGVDHTKGFTWPYLRSELRVNSVYECPDQPWGTYRAQGAASAVTSTYGYNGYFLSPEHTPGWAFSIGHRPWQNIDTLRLPQRLLAFADTMIDLGESVPRNVALLDPPFLYSGGRWSMNRSPTTSFRHRGRTNAALADGHVALMGPGDGVMGSPRFRIGSIGKLNDPHYVPDWRDW